MAEEKRIKLHGRIILEMDIEAVSGLRIGGSPAGLGIGDLDNPVIRDPVTRRPYIPGSSLRGKMRSLWEKATGAPQNYPIRRESPSVYIHAIVENDNYEQDVVCRIFGVTGDIEVPNPTRLIVYDVPLTPETAQRLESVATDQPYTETKWEAVIDRVTSAAVPRQMERVPAGAVFGPARLVYSVYGTAGNKKEDISWFYDVVTMLYLVEDDYLGSSGSRGSGQVRFRNLSIFVRLTGERGEKYGDLVRVVTNASFLGDLPARDDLIRQLRQAFGG